MLFIRQTLVAIHRGVPVSRAMVRAGDKQIPSSPPVRGWVLTTSKEYIGC